MERRDFLKQAGALALAAGTVQAVAKTAPAPVTSNNRPNILLITCHDLGRHLGCYGVKTVHSENIDALAGRGVRFQNFYCTTPICSASRASLHTGRWPQSHGLLCLTHEPWGWSLNPGERHMAAILGEAGYETALIGLQHVSNHPESLGYHQILSPQCKGVETVKQAIAWIENHASASRPFYAEVGFLEVHEPTHWETESSKGVTIPPFLVDTPATRAALAEYQGSIRFLDEYVGQILRALEASPIAQNTLVIFTSDHGIPFPGAKWCLRDPGLEVPLIFYWPGGGLTGGKTLPQMTSNVDVLPTLLDLIGVPIPKNIEGLSCAGVLRGETAAGPRDKIYAQYTDDAFRDNMSRCLRTERYKLIRYFEAGRTPVYPTDVDPKLYSAHMARCRTVKGARPVVELYDLQADPHELTNIAQQPQHAKVVRELSDSLWQWMESVNDPLLKGPLVTPYYRRSLNDYRRFGKKG